MTLFWLLAAGLAALAVLFAVLPLLARPARAEVLDQDQLNLALFRQQLEELKADLATGKLDRVQYRDSCRDLERELLHDLNGTGQPSSPEAADGWGLALVLVLALPAFAFAFYWKLGRPDLVPQLAPSAAHPAASAEPSGTAADQPVPALDQLVKRLAAKMQEHPDNLEGWLMLGRTYFALNQPIQALQALEKAYSLAPDHPDVLLAYAEALAANTEGRLAGRPAELIREALQRAPQHVTGRWLDGLVAYQAEDFAGAVARWEALLASLDPEAEDAGELRQFIAEARERGGLPPMAGAPTAAPVAVDSPPPVAGGQIRVQVTLAKALWKQAEVHHSLFVYAQAVSGPPMPLAVRRLRVGDLPVTVTLDDSLAMMPAMRLSAFPTVRVGARISATGQARPSPGDLEGETGPVTPGQGTLVPVVIDRVRP